MLLAAAAAVRLPTLAQPLVEIHGFRQTQTAYTALLYHEHGIDLLRPQVPVLGPPWVVPHEFPIVQAAGALLMNIGLAPDVAMRTIGLISFLLTGWFLFRVTTRLAGRVAAIAALVAFLFSPFGMIWGRTAMIEYTATAGGLAFLAAGMSWSESARPIRFGLAMVAGAIATTVKLSTGGIYLVPLLLHRTARSRWWVFALVLVPIVCGLAWNAYADAVKAASPATAWLTTAAQRDWYFGDLAQRFDISAWGVVVGRLLTQLTGLGLFVWAALSVLEARGAMHARTLMALLAMGVAPLLVVFPLYVVHDYYLAAISPIVALSVGLAVAWLWRRGHTVVLLCAALVWVVVALWFPEWIRMYKPVQDHERTLAAAEYVASRTSPDDLIAIAGRGWDPSVLYYARRRGMMIGERYPADAEKYALIVVCRYTEACEPFRPDQ